jgi:hypothetical protein
MNMANKQAIFEEKLKEYLTVGKKRKGAILDAVIEVTKLSRKAAIKRFRVLQMRDAGIVPKRGRPVIFTPDVIAALKDVWNIGSESCGENLHSQINEYIDSQIKSGAWNHSTEATTKLRAMSLGSVKKYVGRFVRTRRSFGGKSTTQRSSTISMVPIRMDGWDKAETGVVQIDTVAHCGDTTAGDYVFTVNGADVATLWGFRRAQWNKGQEATLRSLKGMRASSPFPWTEIHPDSGGEFINACCFVYAQETNLRMTRSRPYHKNDNCFVEERNGHIVRTFVGFERFDAFEVVVALNCLYDVLTPYLNHFVANRRIVSKTREGARWKVKREKFSKTPYQRVLERADVSDEIKEKLRTEHAALDPKAMRDKIAMLIKKVSETQRRYGMPRKAQKSA